MYRFIEKKCEKKEEKKKKERERNNQVKNSNNIECREKKKDIIYT